MVLNSDSGGGHDTPSHAPDPRAGHRSRWDGLRPAHDPVVVSSEKIERSERVESRTRGVVRTGTVIDRVTDEQTQGPITAA